MAPRKDHFRRSPRRDLTDDENQPELNCDGTLSPDQEAFPRQELLASLAKYDTTHSISISSLVLANQRIDCALIRNIAISLLHAMIRFTGCIRVLSAPGRLFLQRHVMETSRLEGRQ